MKQPTSISKLKGSCYQKRLIFDPDASSMKCQLQSICPNNLKSEISKLIDINEPIQNIFVFKTPLSESQPSAHILYHAFVAFVTKDYWWSIEKNNEGVTLQRAPNKCNYNSDSDDSDDSDSETDKKIPEGWFRGAISEFWGNVVTKYRCKQRTQWCNYPKIIVSDQTNLTVGQILDLAKTPIGCKYDLLTCNCKHFAQTIFNASASNKRYNLI